MLKIIVGEVDNEINVLSRIVSIITRRRINIQSLHVNATDNVNVSCITISFDVKQEKESNDLLAQLNKQISILNFTDCTDELILKKSAS